MASSRASEAKLLEGAKAASFTPPERGTGSHGPHDEANAAMLQAAATEMGLSPDEVYEVLDKAVRKGARLEDVPAAATEHVLEAMKRFKSKKR